MVTKDEKICFSERLNKVLDGAGYPPKGKNRQGLLGKEFGVTQKGARKWLEGEAIPAQKTLVKIASRFNVQPAYLRFGDESETGYKDPLEDPEPKQVYTLDNAPACKGHYQLELRPGVIDIYPQGGIFKIVPWDSDSEVNARFALVRASDARKAMLCEMIDNVSPSRESPYFLSPLIQGKAATDLNLWHTPDSVTILGAIAEVVYDPRLQKT